MSSSIFEKQVNASETFKQAFESTLFRHGYEKSSTAYNKIQMDKQKFLYIRDENTGKKKVTKFHKPCKHSLFHIAVGLGFTLEETEHLLAKLGMCFNDCELLDVIVKFYLEDGNPDIYEVDEELRRHGLPCFIKEDEDASMAA